MPATESDSLVRRLAGPSTGKAGLSKNQEEINRVIADASRGSKFYDNEKRKDELLTQKIEKLMKKKDELMKGVNIAKIEATIDTQITLLEAKRDLTQTICHVDLDAFYASVEVLDDPSLAGKPFGVSGGVLSTASYEARQYGVRSAMPVFIAKKLCPELIVVPTHFPRYTELSKHVMAVFARYDPNMAAAGLDEAYLNITEYCSDHNISPEECVEQMRAAVFEETKLTCSAGIAPNKMLAKICSDKNKPNGQYYLPPEREKIFNFMQTLSVRKVPGIGRVNERSLESMGVQTCKDIYTHRAVISVLDLGLSYLLNAYLGISSSSVEPPARESRKSVGSERTFKPTGDQARLLELLETVAAELEGDLTRTGWTGRTVTLKYKLDNYQLFTRAKSCTHNITTKEELFKIGKELFSKEKPAKLRLIGLRVTHLKDLREQQGQGQGIERFLGPSTSRPAPQKRKSSNDGYMVEDDDDLILGDYESDVDAAPADAVRLDKKPRSAPLPPRSPQRAVVRLKPQTCPVCLRELEVDNAALNAHIDFCLSKGTIAETVAEGEERNSNGARKRAKKADPFDKFRR